jgi:putative tricarboxylic transport membrane protein
MGKPDQFSSLFWFMVGMVVTYLSYRLGLGTLTNPGPGFLPFWCALILSGLSSLVFFHRLLGRTQGETQKLRHLWQGLRWPKGIYVVAAILAYALLFTTLGYLLSTIALLLFLFKAIEPQRWTVAVGGAVLASFASFVLFALWLDVQLPRGVIERFLF